MERVSRGRIEDEISSYVGDDEITGDDKIAGGEDDTGDKEIAKLLEIESVE